jgi:hypothetical protein
MNLSGLFDMNYFWWAFNKVLQPVIPFLVIFIAVGLAGYLLYIIIGAFRQMRG